MEPVLRLTGAGTAPPGQPPTGVVAVAFRFGDEDVTASHVAVVAPHVHRSVVRALPPGDNLITGLWPYADHPVPRFDFFDEEAPIYTHPRNLPPAKMSRCRVDSSVVADGCILYDCEITGSVIGVRTQIGAGTVVRDSVVMGLDYFENEERLQGTGADLPMGIGRHCRIEGAIIDKNCRVGDDVVIADKRHAPDSEGEYHVVRDGVIVIPRGTTIPPGTVI